MRYLLLGCEIAPGQQGAALTPRLHARRLFWWDAEEAKDHQRRNVVGEVADEIGFTFIGERFNRAVDDIANLRFDRLKTARAERTLNDRAQAGVFGWYPRGESRAPLEPATFENALRFFRKRPERRLRILRRERFPVVEDRLDVLVARKYPRAELGRIEDWRLFSCAAIERKGVS
jgi:hypothetical protein